MPSAVERVWRLLRANLDARLQRLEARQARRAGRGGPNQEPQANTPGRPAVDSELAGYYSNLEVAYGSDLETVRDARRRLVRKYHPDLHGADPERQRIATELVKGLNHAFAQLEKRLQKGARAPSPRAD